MITIIANPPTSKSSDSSAVDGQMKTGKIRGLLGRMPMAAPVAFKLHSLLRKPDPDLHELVEVIRCDPGLTARLLKIANSALYAANREITSVDEAIQRFGLRVVGELAAVLGSAQAFSRPSGKGLVDWGKLWRHSVVSGFAAKRLGKAAEEIGFDPSLCFTIGLLHDIGKLCLDELTEDQIDSVSTLIVDQHLPVDEAERAVLGRSHAEIGGVLLKAWGLPGELVSAVEEHSQPRIDHASLALVAHLASACAHVVTNRIDGRAGGCELPYMLFDTLRLEPSDGEAWVQSVIEDFSQIEAFMAIADLRR